MSGAEAGAEVVVDAARSELRGPATALRAIVAGEPAPEGLDPLLTAGLTAARDPLARWTVTGLGETAEGFVDGGAGALLVALAPGQAALRACTPSGFLDLIARAVGLEPRPRHAEDPVTRLAPERMALLLGRRDARAGGLAEAEADRLQPHLDAVRRHWRIEVRRSDGIATSEHAAGWYLEVVDGALGLWAVEEAGDEVALAPTDATAVLSELAALPAGSRSGMTQERLGYADPMCRNIRTLHNFEPPATHDEVHAAALQYVRKISGSTRPSKANEAAFERAVAEVTAVSERLLDALVTVAPPKDREAEAIKARARAQQRYAPAVSL